ncbi:PepSY domain-containing protein [Rheinheimera maricola]|uniref:PepSY domain-containing protein n=1 Tax=Rheinheimera maricola TaxID=2793282 RepID=A0ABS7X959_9GAMM|nr:PepSY domain-containing protein [Rheinheimera maricola]MBZ9611705.1 PepSY domain-containing protein [Rheinheimera maricola]
MLRHKVLVLLTVMLLTSTLSSAALAMTSPKRPAVTKEQAAQLAQQRYPGKIVKVQTEQQFYRIRLLQSDGRVITVLVDGRTGRVQREGN